MRERQFSSTCESIQHSQVGGVFMATGLAAKMNECLGKVAS
jgi:hypothetical protein